MRHHLNLRSGLVAAGFAVLVAVGAHLARLDQAQARVPTPQSSSLTSSETPLARDAETFEADRKLEAACRKSGQANATCLCVTHILKYELTLSEYRAVTRLYGQSLQRAGLRRTLREEGFSAADINRAETIERDLIQENDFAQRCSEAKAYYKR